MVLIRPIGGRPRGRLTSTLARRLGIRRLIVESRRAGRVVSLLLFVGLVAALVGCFSNYSFFVYGAEVYGNRLLSDAVLYEASGIDGYSIFWIEPEAVEASLEALPYVEDARVRCWLPNRVEIYVTEREPILLWRARGEVLWVGEDGGTMQPTIDLPGLIQVEDEQGDAAGPEGGMNPDIVLGIQRIHQLLPEVDLFYYNRTHGLQFVTPNGVQVYLGDGQDMAYKVRVFEAIKQQVEKEGRMVRVIDIRYPNNPFVR